MLIRSRARHVPSGGGGGGGTPLTLGTLKEYLALPGGQEVIVANGTYPTGLGNVTDAHSTPLILKAETLHGVTIDLSTADANAQLKLYTGFSNVVFVGFNFINGTVQLAGAADVTFWYCDFTYPPDVWKAQYLAAGGFYPANSGADRTSFVNLVNTQPSCIRVRGTLPTAGGSTTNLKIIGSDFHDVTDDASIISLISGFTYIGNRAWDISEKDSGGSSVDPGSSFGSSGDWFHEDQLQINGALANATIEDSWFGQKIQLGVAFNAVISNVAMRRLWFAGSGTHGNICGISGSGSLLLACTQDTIRAFCNGQINGAAYNKFRTDFRDGVQVATWPSQYNAPGIFENVATNVTTTIPSGVTVAGDGFTLTDVTQVRDHLLNPANIWRAANPYSSYNTYLGI